MSIQDAITTLDKEINKLKHARAVLVGPEVPHKLRKKAEAKQKQHYNLSAEGRKKIAAAVRLRWKRQKESA